MGKAGKRAATYGAGTIFKRGRIWYVSYYVDGQQFIRSTRSTNLQKAKQFRDQILGRKARGELAPGPIGHTTCGELLDDVLEYAHSNLKASKQKVARRFSAVRVLSGSACFAREG